MRLVSAILARNEAASDRYLQRVLANAATFCDDILVLDDGSTDDTPAICKAAGATVVQRGGSGANGGWWGGGQASPESSARQQLWEEASKLAGPAGWVLVQDADMLLQGSPASIRALCQSWEAAAWAMPLADLWDSEQTFRVDGPWSAGPTRPRPWLFHTGAQPVGWRPQWSGRAMHAGHCPLNWHEVGPTLVAPPDIYWLHLSYLRPEHRRAKLAQYQRVADQLTDFERSHALSVGDTE